MKTLRALLKFSLGLAVILCLGSIFEFQFSPIATVANFVEVSSIKRQLPQAKARWEAKGISNYSVEIDADIPFCWFDVIINVRDNVVASVIERDAPWKDLDMCRNAMDPSRLRIPQFLDKVEREVGALDWLEDALAIDFDPDFGYVTYYRSSCSYRTHSIGDCILVYKFTNFQLINDSSP
jgi:hypothetical protein